MNEAMALPLWTPRVIDFGSWKWLGRWALIVLISVCLVLVGCGFASFVAAAQADIPVVIQIVTNITNIIAPGISLAIGAAGALALGAFVILCGHPAPGAKNCDPTSLIGQYHVATDPTVQTTLLQKIDAALSAVNSNISSMLVLAKGLPQAIGNDLVLAIQIAYATVTLLIGLLPAAKAYTAGDKNGAKRMAAAFNVPGPGALRHSYNNAVKNHWPGAVIA